MSINQQIKPVTTEENENLRIGGCDLTELAKRYGTPLYVIDEATLRGICREYKQAFQDYKNIKMMYACKALCTSAIIKILNEEGFVFDVVSAGEIYTVYKAGVDMKKVLFNGNNVAFQLVWVKRATHSCLFRDQYPSSFKVICCTYRKYCCIGRK